VADPKTTIHLRLGCEFEYEVPSPTAAVLQVEPRPDGPARVLTASFRSEPEVPTDSFADHYANSSRRLTMPPGAFRCRYETLVELVPALDEADETAAEVPPAELTGELLHFVLPSRYCLSDVLMQTAWDLFGSAPPGWSRVQAVTDWVHGNLRFRYGASNPLTTAKDVYDAREGVCRDFAHLAISFCRALNIPARYAFGYLPDVWIQPDGAPMDFAAWIEVWLGGRWWTFDPRNNRRRAARVVIVRGRDALDCAMVTTFGGAVFRNLEVWAEETGA